MIKKLFLVPLLVTLAGLVSAQKLSTDAHISLITLGPSQKELYSAFGHSAIRVYDPAQGIDYFFNYGVFSFNQPNFYLNFARGRNMYQLGVYDYPAAKAHYASENRNIQEQILRLTARQKQRVFDFLTNNAQPDNKYYLYDYFYDNCATRPRDVLKTVLGDSIKFDETPEKAFITIRGLTDIYLKQQPWGDLGIDICLGLPMDKVASRTEYMFLPDSLASGFDRALIKNDTLWTSLVKESILVAEGNPEKERFSLFHPWIVFGLTGLLLIGFSIRDIRRRKRTIWIDNIMFSATGLIGILLTLLWFATDHKAAANNLNVLWAIPFNIVFVFVRRANMYFLIITVLTVILMITWAFLPQDLHEFLLPLVIGLGSRYWVNYKLR